MSRDWSWLDDFKNGDDDAFSKSLAEETDRSLKKDPSRWPSQKVPDTEDTGQDVKPFRGGHGPHGRSGTGGQTEPHDWSAHQWRTARDDYLLKNQAHLRDERERREAEDAREREERAWRDELFQTRDHEDRGGGKGLFW